MALPTLPRGAVRFGFWVGSIFGSWNVLYSWLFPLVDDTPAALLAFYGPMFFLWAVAAFLARRRTGVVQALHAVEDLRAAANNCFVFARDAVRLDGGGERRPQG